MSYDTEGSTKGQGRAFIVKIDPVPVTSEILNEFPVPPRKMLVTRQICRGL